MEAETSPVWFITGASSGLGRALAETTLDPEAHLVDQPRGVQLEYRIVAENAAGQSAPGNVVAAVL